MAITDIVRTVFLAATFGIKTALKGLKTAKPTDLKSAVNPLWWIRKIRFVIVLTLRHIFAWCSRDNSKKSLNRWKAEALDPDAFARLDNRFKSYSAGQDVQEILSYLPALAPGGNRRLGDVLELACGTGRFTEVLMQSARSVVAQDLVPEFVDGCREKFKTKPNSEIVQFRAGDARALNFPDNSFDVVFWSWLMMYFNDEQIAEFLPKVERWLKPGGVFLFREAIAGDDKAYDQYETSVNGEFVREADAYNQALAKHTSLRLGGVHTLESLKQPTERLCWVYHKDA